MEQYSDHNSSCSAIFPQRDDRWKDGCWLEQCECPANKSMDRLHALQKLHREDI